MAAQADIVMTAAAIAGIMIRQNLMQVIGPDSDRILIELHRA
jgi:hypothetical protein